MITLTKQGVFDADLMNAINQNFANLFPSQGQSYFVDPAKGSDGNDGLTPQTAKATLLAAYTLAPAGKNSVIYLLSDGATSSSVRLSANFAWAKNATHLIGVSSGVTISNRSRIAPAAGVAAFADFFTVSGNGCLFSNIEFFQGFDTGIAAERCLVVTGARNQFNGCHIAGMGDTVGAHDTGSRNLYISAGENQFIDCTIGLDTIARDVANASIEIAGGAARNVFKDCVFLIYATNSGAFLVLTAGAAAIDRVTLFDRCTFLNSIKSGTGTSITGACSLAASAGGLLMFRDLAMVGVSSIGADATSRAQIYEFGPANSTSTGIGANPA